MSELIILVSFDTLVKHPNGKKVPHGGKAWFFPVEVVNRLNDALKTSGSDLHLIMPA